MPFKRGDIVRHANGAVGVVVKVTDEGRVLWINWAITPTEDMNYRHRHPECDMMSSARHYTRIGRIED